MKVISPQERLDLLPFEPAVINAVADWPHIRLEDYRNLPPSDLVLQPMDYHIVAFHYKPPQGVLRHRCGGAWHESQMRQFDITYVPAGRDNQWQFDGQQPHCLHILLHKDFMEQVVLTTWEIEPTALFLQAQFQCQNALLQDLAFKFHGVVLQNQSRDTLYLERLGTTLATYLLTNFTDRLSLPTIPHRLTQTQLDFVIDYLREHLAEPITLERMALRLNLSVFHFSRMFRQNMGISPYQFLIKLRLEEGLKLLVNAPNQTISQIALMVGFSDQSHFTRHFRQRYGVTPYAFRRHYSG